MVEMYNSLLKHHPLIQIPQITEGAKHVFQTYAVLLDEKINRNKLIINMRENGIQTQIGTYSSFIQPVYKSKDTCRNSLRLFNSTLALPLHHELTEDNIGFIVETLLHNINKV
jgi:dTDP-4-amino-4,6-dideoxygalactose transaminase